jgi:hypothetical protein
MTENLFGLLVSGEAIAAGLPCFTAAMTLRSTEGEIQATLSELSGLTERTIQRIEGGEPCSVDTRRTLARAFDWQDIDVFNKPWPRTGGAHGGN